MSSGQNVYDRNEFVLCECGYDGTADVFYDPNAYWFGWDCPECGNGYEGEMGWVDYG